MEMSSHGFSVREQTRPRQLLCNALLALLLVTSSNCPACYAALEVLPSSSPSKTCEKICYNGGTCQNGICICPAGWSGSQCDSCFGRIRSALITCMHTLTPKYNEDFSKSASADSFISDGPINYSAASKCIWIIEGGEGPLVLRLDEFFTECCWGRGYTL